MSILIPSEGGAASSRARQAKRTGRADPTAARIEDIGAAIETVTSSYLNPNATIRFSADGGRVALWGEVDWHYQKMEIELAVRRVRGVRDLTSDLVLLGLRDRAGGAGSCDLGEFFPTSSL